MFQNAHKKICVVYGDDALTVSSCHNCKTLICDFFCLRITPCSFSPMKTDNDKSGILTEADHHNYI